jgi:enamine deaminase RidA (YjgF/YER057c/UK114 family)
MCVYERMKQLGIDLPQPPPPGGIYFPAKLFAENMLYTSGAGPIVDGKPAFTGKVGKDLTLSQGQEAARLTMLNILAAVQARIGDLNRIKSFVKILGFVASSEDFYDQPQVINGASQLLVDIFGEQAGKAARSAIGTHVLPGNIPVEIEVLIELEI